MRKLDPAELDPGIRKTVMWLRKLGFDTTDSGDGVSKFEELADPEALTRGEPLPYPHVFIRIDFPSGNLIQESHRLRDELRKFDTSETWTVEASYNPADKVGVIALIGFNDEMLRILAPSFKG